MIPEYLECSPAYRYMADEDRDANCGCGTAKSKFVPDTLYFLSVTPACCIHDWDYGQGKTEADKHKADNRFLRNMYAIIDNAPGWINRRLRVARRSRARKYWIAVRLMGNGAFWDGKTNPADPTVHIS